MTGNKSVDMENEKIYDLSMSDDAAQSRQPHNPERGEGQGQPPDPAAKQVWRRVDPELERLLDEENRIARSGSSLQELMRFTYFFTHGGREADLEIVATYGGVLIRMKTLVDQGAVRRGHMAQVEFSFDEWDTFLSMLKMISQMVEERTSQ